MSDFVRLEAVPLVTASVLRSLTLEDQVMLDNSNSAIRGCDKFLPIF